MTTKRKLWTSIASLALVFVLAGTVVGVTLAALTGNVTSGFTINYTALNVSAGIFGSWGYSENSMTKMTSGGDDKILFTGSETGAQANKSFDDLGEIKLSNENRSVTFKFKFLNFDKNGKDYPLTFTLDGDMDNLNVNYTVNVFDGEETDTKTGSETNLPLSVTSSIPYSGFSSYEAYEAAGEVDDEMVALARILFKEGVDALQAELDSRYYKNPDFDPEEGEYGQILEYVLGVLELNIYRIYWESGSKEEIKEFIASVDLLSLLGMKEAYVEEYGEEAAEELNAAFKSFAFDETGGGFDYIPAFEHLIQGDYTSDLDYWIGEVVDDVYGVTSGMDAYVFENGFYGQKIMIWNIYEKFITDGYEAAIDFIDGIYERKGSAFSKITPIEGANYYYLEYEEYIYEDLKNELSQWNEMGDEGIQTARSAQQEVEAYIEQYAEENKDYFAETQALIQRALSEGDAPYTEIIVTISLSDEAGDAYLNSGSFEFVLGKQN